MKSLFSHRIVARTSGAGRRMRRTCVAFFVLSLCLSVARGRGATADSLIVLTSSDLPIVVIDTHGGEIRNEPKITADMGVIDNGAGIRNHPTDPFNAYLGKIGIEIRGSSSTMFPKKQYAVETRDSLGADMDVALLGMPAESDWILSAPYNDKTLIRDVVVYTLARRMGRYASRARFCELILNRQYAGVYVLFEKIKRDKGRVNIAKMESADSTGDALTGGYIIKIDKTDGADIAGWYSGFLPFVGAAYKVLYQFHYPKSEDLVWPQRGYITRYIRDFELAMYIDGFNDPVNGYPHLLDASAFVDYVLLNELSKNVDAYRLSCFMCKERDSKGGKLFMGPVWDYNIAFGNCDYHRAFATDGFQISYMSDSMAFRKNEPFLGPFWWMKIFDDPPLRQQLNRRWSALRQGELSTDRIMSLIDSLTNMLGESRQRNFIRWPVLGQKIWPNVYVGKTYADEVAYMKTWIVNRLNWMDRELVVTSVGERGDAGEVPQVAELQPNFPNPFNPGTSVPYVVHRRGVIEIKVFDLLGREVALLVNAAREPGTYAAVFDGSRLAGGMYVCRLLSTPLDPGSAGSSPQLLKMLLVR
jgi:hypothetical protein